ncbi:MAG: phosphoenolpyruvate--protein phosphotransferase [Parachlamydiales bacterium]|jgi:phosphotransferase system enzyme I (PtsI)
MTKTATRQGELRLQGTPVCRGVAIGKPFFYAFDDTATPEFSVNVSEVETEIARYRRALERSRLDIERLRRQMDHEQVTEGAAILEAHLQILDDPLLTSDIESLIVEMGKNAEVAFLRAMNTFQQRFEAMRDPFFRERFNDIQDVARRIMGHLRHSVRISLAEAPAGVIIIANELSASEAAEADPSKVLAFVTEAGGMTTHAAIIAKAKGIPYIARLPLRGIPLSENSIIIVDGRTGEVILDPHPDTLTIYSYIQKQLSLHIEKLQHTAQCHAETFDGLRMNLCANVEAVEEIDLLHQYGANGIGLLRSENAFMFKDTFPNEEEQFTHYRTFVERMKGLPTVIRTFDIGGDKSFIGRIEGSDEPFFVGCRAIQFLLQERNIFKRQLRAILRAAAVGNVSILFPMITSLPELREAKILLEEAKSELINEGIIEKVDIRIGCMIEVPSAAVIADLLARECDFLSIGTNDLVHYSLAVDRGNHAASTLSSLCHPSLLRLIKMVVVEANLQGIPVTICGEIASDPRFTPLLLGLGVHELSVACRYLPLVKNAIRCTSAVFSVELARQALALSTSAEVQDLIAEAYRDAVPEDCFYNF